MASQLDHADTTNIGLDEQHERGSRISSSDDFGSDHEAFQAENAWDLGFWPDSELSLEHTLTWPRIPAYDNDFLNDFGLLDASAPLGATYDQPFKQHDHQSLCQQSGDYNDQLHLNSVDGSGSHRNVSCKYSRSKPGRDWDHD
jgi:hypothetical protein